LRIVIVANGWLNQPIVLQPGDLLIAADGGAKHCLKLGLFPESIIGDLDSLSDQELESLQSRGAKIIRYPTRKDYTDLELALKHAQELGASEIIVFGALGARWDQTIANLLLPVAIAPTCIRLVDGAQEIFFVRSGERFDIYGHRGDVVSLIPLAGDAHGITTQNLEYPLKEDSLNFGSTRGISNVLLAEHATVHLKEGLLLCTVIHL
jgi:thiamine pyrophosphokinase